MLPLSFESIQASDVLALVDQKIGEHKTLEYKAELSIATSDAKAEFLADVSSFANASGGGILFGISDERDASGKPTGIPDSLVPLRLDNAAAECARVEQLIESGIQPRLPLVQVKAVPVPSGYVIVLRAGKSWIAPHMVSYVNRTRFFSRNSSTGKVQLDVQQIGALFAQRHGLEDRLRDWKAGRIAKNIAAEGPISMTGARALLHFIPAAALMNAETHPRKFDFQSLAVSRILMSLSVESSRYNADGFLMSSRLNPDSGGSYLQVFRSGALEYCDSWMLSSMQGEHVPSKNFEQKVVDTFERAKLLLDHLEVEAPIFTTMTLVGVKGKTMALPHDVREWSYVSDPFDREIVFSPNKAR